MERQVDLHDGFCAITYEVDRLRSTVVVGTRHQNQEFLVRLLTDHIHFAERTMEDVVE